MPPELFTLWIGLTGLLVGSFLNVVIYRYPLEGVTVNNPKRSRCPKCKHGLSWYENVPLFSWLIQKGRCRHCAGSIPWRYPLVEALNAGLWLLAFHVAGGMQHWALGAVYCLVLSALLVATFVDLDNLEIPDSVSIGGMVVGPVLCLLVPEIHSNTWIAYQFGDSVLAQAGTPELTRFGALVASLAGVATGWCTLFAISYLGGKAFGKDAMGFGDVKLLGAAGAFVGPGGALMVLMIGSVFGSIFGVLVIAWWYNFLRSRARQRGVHKSRAKALSRARMFGEYIPFGPYLAAGIGIALLYWNDVLELLLQGAR
jgi:leader peptidase (prepilin peptidase)/N-methyltransferase